MTYHTVKYGYCFLPFLKLLCLFILQSYLSIVLTDFIMCISAVWPLSDPARAGSTTSVFLHSEYSDIEWFM